LITVGETVATVIHVCDHDGQMWSNCENKVGYTVSSTVCDRHNTLCLTVLVSLFYEAIVYTLQMTRCFDPAATMRFHKKVQQFIQMFYQSDTVPRY